MKILNRFTGNIITDLQKADLRKADLQEADLREANLQEADLRWADLRWADLHWADLRKANLQEADLDLSSFPLWCGSLNFKSDRKIRVQLAFHFLSLIKHDKDACKDEKEILKSLVDYANEFHVKSVGRL